MCWCVWPFLELESVVLVAFIAVPGLCSYKRGRFLNVTRRRWIATSDVRQQSTLLDVNTHWHDERSLHTGPVVTTYPFAKSERELFLEKRVEERTSTHTSRFHAISQPLPLPHTHSLKALPTQPLLVTTHPVDSRRHCDHRSWAEICHRSRTETSHWLRTEVTERGYGRGYGHKYPAGCPPRSAL